MLIILVENGKTKWIRVALMNVACDTPAIQKVLRFLSHNAIMGCWKCLLPIGYKKHPCTLTEPDMTDRNGLNADNSDSKSEKSEDDSRDAQHGTNHSLVYNCVPIEDLLSPDNWPKWHLADHKQHSERHRIASSEKERWLIEKQQGVRYCMHHEQSPLLQCYLTPCNWSHAQSAPWHCKANDVHMDSDETHQCERPRPDAKQVNDMQVLHAIGQIPRKVASTFAGFTAEQWRSWTIVYSLFALKDTTNYLPGWKTLPMLGTLCTGVIAILFTCNFSNWNRRSRWLSAEISDELPVDLYCREKLVPNLHFHLHIKECIEDYIWPIGF